MKNKITLVTLIAILLLSEMVSATVWRVNNRVNASADFTSIQAAHDGVAGGDTLYVEGSPTSYGTLVCVKQLHLIGAGEFLNDNDSTQAYKQASKVGTITFNVGSENSIVEGLRFDGSGVIINTSNITIRRNKIVNGHGASGQYKGISIAASCSDILIENNWIYIHAPYYTSQCGIYSVGTDLTNLVIRNNYIYCFTAYYGRYSISLAATVLADNVSIYQNVFDGSDNYPELIAKEVQFFNNIMIKGTYTPNGSFYNNNIGNSTQFGTANGNQQNIAAATIFIDPTSGVDSDLMLKVGSPALGAGLFGEDCGIYGADHPYVVSLLPAIPAIWDVSLNNYGNDNVTIDVNIKAKSHN